MAVPLDVLHSFAFEPKHSAWLGAGWHLNRHFAIQGRYDNLGAQGGLNETNGHFTQQIVAIALEDFVRFYVQDDVKISGGAAAPSCFAITARAPARAGIHTGGDSQFNFGGPLPAAIASA